MIFAHNHNKQAECCKETKHNLGGLRRRAARQVPGRIPSDSDGSRLSVKLRIRGNPPCKTWDPRILSSELWAHTGPASDVAGVFKERAEEPWMEEGRPSRNAKGKG